MAISNELEKIELVEEAEAALVRNGFHVFRAQDFEAACAYLVRLAGAGPAVKSYSAALNTLGLKEYFHRSGVSLLDTRLSDYLAAAEGISAGNSFFPLEGMDTAKVLALLKKHFNLPDQMEYSDAAEAARKFLREQTAIATLGITGANAIVAETGSIAILEDQGNARLVSNLPPIHAVVAPTLKIVPTMAGALMNLRNESIQRCGRSMAKYLSFISGPSKTGDIGFQLVKGMHGPGEVHIILI